MKMIDVLLGASLIVGAGGCPCPDGEVEATVMIERAAHKDQIDACLKNDAACEALCRSVFEIDPGALISRCLISAIDDEDAIVEATYDNPVPCVGGRRPGGFIEPRCRSRAAGEWLAQLATVEAASITAFARLVRALQRFEAPARLIAAARDAIVDEIVHARLIAQLARRMGARVEAPVIVSGGEPTLAELARENAIEGQVAETFGALLAMCQSQLAADPEVRGVFAQIALDEARHAELAHELAPWFDSRLDAEARALVAAARTAAASNLRFDVELGAADRALLGIPDVTRLCTAAAGAFATLAA